MPDKEKTIHAAFIAAYRQIENPQKNAKNPHFKNNYADLNAVLASIKPALNKHGLALIQRVESNVLHTLVINEKGETVALGEMPILNQKGDAQGFGSGLSYAKRYALLSAFGLASEDDDGHAASQPAQQRLNAPSAGEQAQIKVKELGMALVNECGYRPQQVTALLDGKSSASLNPQEALKYIPVLEKELKNPKGMTSYE